MKKVTEPIDTTESVAPQHGKEPNTVTLTHEDANKVLEYLASQPYRDVFQLINIFTTK